MIIIWLKAVLWDNAKARIIFILIIVIALARESRWTMAGEGRSALLSIHAGLDASIDLLLGLNKLVESILYLVSVGNEARV